MDLRENIFDLEDDFDSAQVGDEVAYEDEQQEMFEHYRFDIAAGQVPMRVDKYLATHMEYTSRHRIQLAIKAEYIRVNDKIVKANYVVRPGDVVTFVMPYQRRGLEILPEAIPLNIVHEDDDVLVLNKEAGMVVHPGHGHFSGTLVNALAHHLGISQGPDAQDERMGVLVHRIDKDTSGLLVVAKNDEAQLDLAKQFFVHSIERRYVAIVWGNLKEDEGTIIGNIGRDPNDRMRFKVFPEGDPRRETCSYIELELEYRSATQYSYHKNLIYRFYLGDSRNNLDVERNCHYSIIVRPEDDGLSGDGWRVDKSGLMDMGRPYIKGYPADYIRGDIGDKIHLWCELMPWNAPLVIDTEVMDEDKAEGIYDYVIDEDGHGVTLTLTGPGSGIVYMEAGDPINDAALFIIEVNLP